MTDSLTDHNLAQEAQMITRDKVVGACNKPRNLSKMQSSGGGAAISSGRPMRGEGEGLESFMLLLFKSNHPVRPPLPTLTFPLP